MTHSRILLVLIATLAFNIYAGAQDARWSTDRVKIIGRLAPPEPTIVRLNGTGALTRKLVPALADQIDLPQPPDRWDIPCGDGCSHNFIIMHVGPAEYGATWKAYLTDISLEAAVNGNSLDSEFRSAPENRGEIDTNYRFEDAKLKFTFHVETKPKTPLDGIVPEQVKKWSTISENFRITITGIAGELDVTLKKKGEFVAVDMVDQFTAELDHVSVTDSARLLEVANKVASLGDLFGVPGPTSVNDAATKLANILLKQDFGMKRFLRDGMNDGLAKLTNMEFGTQRFSVGRGGSLALTQSLMGLRTTSGRAVTEWTVNVDGDPSGAAPELAYVPVSRPVEDINQLAPQGDVELFVPYSLVDKTMYEIVKMGSLSKITVPRSSANGITVGFDLMAEPTETPRVDPAAGDSDTLVVRFAARLADTTIGSIDVGLRTARASDSITGPRTVPGVPDHVPVRLTDGSARVAIYFRLQATDRGGLDLIYVNVKLEDLTGSLSAASVTTPLNLLQAPLRNAIHAHLSSTMSRINLIQKAVQLIPGVRVSMEQPRRGVRYLGLPLTLIAD